MTHEFLAYQIIVIALIVFLIARAFFKLLKGKKSLREFIVAILIWVGIGTVALYPNLAQLIANLLGFELGINAILTISTIILFFAILSLIVKTDKNNSSLTKMVRAIAIQNMKRPL